MCTITIYLQTYIVLNNQWVKEEGAPRKFLNNEDTIYKIFLGLVKALVRRKFAALYLNVMSC
jgi:hypothetical protein